MKEKYLDSTLTPAQRAADLLEKMNVKEKMAQLNCFMPSSADLEEAREKCPNGIGQISTLDMRRVENLQEAAQFQTTVQKIVMEQSEHHIPAIFHMEGLCGAYIQGATSFPSGIGRGASWNPELEKEVAKVVARQERAVGISHVFGPVLDISRDSRMGRQGETYGEDPTLAAALGAYYTKGIQEGERSGLKAESVAKHFLAFHNSQGGIHGTNSDTPERLLDEIYGKPFQAAITESGLKGIMPCYGSINGEPASASKKIMTDLLRQEMGFEGITVSDYCAIMNIHSVQNVCESFTEAGLRSMSAGMDMELHFTKCFNEELEEWFETGKADMNILDTAVRRVLETKFRMGLFEHPFALENDALTEEFYDERDEEVTLQSARESMILLKNDGSLPLKKTIRKIAVIGCHAVNARTFFGGYTHLSMAEGLKAAENSMAGVGNSTDTAKAKIITIPGTQIQSDEMPEFDAVLKLQKPNCNNLLEELQIRLPEVEFVYSYGYPVAGNDVSRHESALKAAKEADLVILTLGGKHGTSSIASMGEGIDATDINLPVCQDEFIKKAAQLNIPIVGIHFNGRPISSDVADNYLNAIIEAWNPAEKGAQAIVDVLTGAYNPSGKLPVSVAYNAGQIPIYYNHPAGSAYHQGESIGFKEYVDMPHTPRYFFGYGISYTTFEYSNLKVEKKEVNPEETVNIYFDIQNTGSVAGTEIVQLYLKDRYASMTRPVIELAGFARIELQPQEKKRVTFAVTPSQLAFLDIDMKWKIEAGDIDVLVGSSSNDIHLKDSFCINKDMYIEGRKRVMYAKSDIV